MRLGVLLALPALAATGYSPACGKALSTLGNTTAFALAQAVVLASWKRTVSPAVDA
eukprot:gene7337-5502_t